MHDMDGEAGIFNQNERKIKGKTLKALKP